MMWGICELPRLDYVLLSGVSSLFPDRVNISCLVSVYFALWGIFKICIFKALVSTRTSSTTKGKNVHTVLP